MTSNKGNMATEFMEEFGFRILTDEFGENPLQFNEWGIYRDILKFIAEKDAAHQAQLEAEKAAYGFAMRHINELHNQVHSLEKVVELVRKFLNQENIKRFGISWPEMQEALTEYDAHTT